VCSNTALQVAELEDKLRKKQLELDLAASALEHEKLKSDSKVAGAQGRLKVAEHELRTMQGKGAAGNDGDSMPAAGDAIWRRVLQVKEECIENLTEEKLSAAAAVDMLQLRLIAASQDVSVLKSRAVAHEAEVSRIKRRLKLTEDDRQQLQNSIHAVEADLHAARTQIKVLEYKLEDAQQQRAKESEMMARIVESARIAGEQKAEAAKDEVAHLERVLSREIQESRLIASLLEEERQVGRVSCDA
jgi:chromosome segregation ATPase